MANLLNNAALYLANAAIAAALNTDADSQAIDTANADGVLFLVPIADSVATGVATVKVEQSATSNGTFAPTAATVTATCAVNDDLNGKILAIDVIAPTKRWVRVNITSATANIAFDATTAIAYAGRAKPVAQATAEVLASGTFVSPAEV
jgi:hypothetical protein